VTASIRFMLHCMSAFSLQGTSIEDFGVQLARGWRIGQQGKNNGVLLIVVPSEHKVRIEVGYGLEGTLTDAVSKLVIESAIIPRFRANDVPGGVTRGVDDIIGVLTGDAEEWKQRAAKRPDPTPPWGTILILILVVFIMIVGVMQSHPLVTRVVLVVRFLGRVFWRRRLIRRWWRVGKLVRGRDELAGRQRAHRRCHPPRRRVCGRNLLRPRTARERLSPGTASVGRRNHARGAGTADLSHVSGRLGDLSHRVSSSSWPRYLAFAFTCAAPHPASKT